MDHDFTYNLKKWASEVVHSVCGCTGDPSQAMTQSIIKVSQREVFNSDQVARLCEPSNYDVYVDCYRQDPEDVYASPIVENQVVLKALYGHPPNAKAVGLVPAEPPRRCTAFVAKNRGMWNLLARLWGS